MSYCSVCFLALGSRLSAAVVQLVSLKLHPSANRCCRQEVQANLPGEVRYVPTMQSWRVWFGIGDILGCPRPQSSQPSNGQMAERDRGGLLHVGIISDTTLARSTPSDKDVLNRCTIGPLG